MSHEPPAPSDPQSQPYADPSQWVNMRWQGALGWGVATGLCVYLTVGLTVFTIVMAVSGEIWGTLGSLALTVVLGLLCWPLLRMTPRYTTQQGVLVDGAGVTLVQEPKRWFPGRKAHIPWSQVSHISQDRMVISSENGRKVQYFIDIDLGEPLRGAELPSWAGLEESKVRIKPSKARHTETVQVLRNYRPDLFPGD